MDRKGSRSARVCPGRSKKRKFSGNRHTVENETAFASTSAKKILQNKDIEVTPTPTFFYCILEFTAVFQAISSAVVCKKCHKTITFNPSRVRGLGFKILMQCECSEKLINSGPLINTAFEINKRFIFTLRLLGIGLEGANLFSGIMDLGHGLAKNTYYSILENIHTAASAVYEVSLFLAVKKEKELNKEDGHPEDELTVSGDGTWKKRGFSSLFGVSTLIGKYSKQVLDTCVKSSFCAGCNMWKNKKNSDSLGYEEWLSNHENCSINHSGSSGKMEIDAIIEMFSRSVEKHGVKYLTYIGDGDSKTFKGILNANPYTDEKRVVKKECVGHVEKRMGSRLRNIKKTNKGIGGKGSGKLTDKLIGELTRFYGLAIRRNPDSLEKMKKEIWATYYHCCSSDDNPQHDYCPEGEDSWCKWRKAESLGLLDNFKHTRVPLNSRVQEVIKPIYEDLSRDDLIQRCLGAETQNNNESLNSLIWTFAPKTLHSGPKVIELATFLAVIIFNNGFKGVLKIMETLGLKIGLHASNYAYKRDNDRLLRSERRSSNSAKQSRIENREEASSLRDFQEKEEGVLYGPGIAE